MEKGKLSDASILRQPYGYDYLQFGLSAKTLNARLAKMGVQYRQGGAWILYAKYQGNGYTHTVSVPYMMANGEQGTQIQTRWTEKGRKFLHDLLDNK